MISTLNLNLDFNFTSLFYDLITYFSIVIFLVILEKKKRISQIELFILTIFCATPLFFNNIFFNWYEFPDQKKYVEGAFEFRDFNKQHGKNTNVFFSSLFYSFFPIISFQSINSVAFINKILIVCLYVFFKKKNVSKIFLYSLIIYPSIIIYSSLSLREILIVFLMLLSGYFFFKKNYIIFIIFAALLFLIKEQFSAYMLISLFIFRNYIELKQNFITNILSVIILLFAFFILNDQLLEILDRYRNGFVREIGGYQEVLNSNAIILNNSIESKALYIFQIIFSYLKSFLYPLTSGVELKKIIFFIDNVFYSALFFITCLVLFKENKKYVIFWLASYLIVNFLMSFIAINEMTLLRYKFPWVIFHIFCLSYTCRNKHSI